MSYLSQEHLRVATQHVSSYFKDKPKTVTVNGQPFKYLELGPKDGEVILFLHGVGSNKSVWRSQMQSYDNKRYRRIALDVPGACMTTFLNKKHSLSELARWLDAILNALDVETAHIAAHSVMSMFACYYEGTRPGKVKTLALIALPDIWSPGALQPGGTIDNFRKTIDYKCLDDYIAHFNSVFHAPPKIPKTLQKLNYIELKKKLPTFFKTMDEFIETLPLVMPHTKNTSHPTLIFCGKYDELSPPEFVESLDWHFPQAQVVILTKSGHIPMMEQPRDVFQIHEEFLLTHTVTRLSANAEFGKSPASVG